jgi:hypothetical protein
VEFSAPVIALVAGGFLVMVLAATAMGLLIGVDIQQNRLIRVWSFPFNWSFVGQPARTSNP